MAALEYSGIRDNRYTPGREIGRGGEGTVFEVKQDASLVMKIYNDALDKDKAEKLLYMASVASDEYTKFAAWPLDVIRDGSMRVCGFTMKKLVAYVPLHRLFSPMERKKLFPDKGYNFLVHVAQNLATAFNKIHQLDIIIGDVNEANILVNPNGMVALIDCDSFQVKNGNRYHFCEVGIPRYTPPELLEGGSFSKVIRTPNTDAFSLATLIFQLLFLGRAPFTGTNLTKEEVDEEKAIKAHEFAYSLRRQHKKLTPAKNSLQLKYFPPGIINSFHSAFEAAGARPTPRQWMRELEGFGNELILCDNSKIHYYSKSMQRCPWCFFKEKAGIVYFLDDSYLKSTAELSNVEQFVNGFKLEKLKIKKLNENYTTGTLIAAPIGKRFTSLKNLNKKVLGAIILATLIACFVFSWGCIAIGLLGAVLFIMLSPAQKTLQQELDVRKKTCATLKHSLQSLLKQYNSAADMDIYNQTSYKLSGLITHFRNLPLEFDTQKRKIDEKYYNIKYKQYLFQFDIREHQIPSFGPSKKDLLYKNGIRTAADINKLNKTKIAGIGSRNIQVLLEWQRDIGTGFVYSPDFTVINKEISIASNEINVKKAKLEMSIKNEYKGFLALKTNIQTSTSSLERQYHEVAIKLYQSELDLTAFEEFMKRI